MADASRWYYAVSNERQGPLGTDEMVALRRAGSIQDETLVWTDGMTDWSPLRDTPLGQSPIPPVPGVPPPFAPGGDRAGHQDGGAPPVSGFGEAISTCFSKYVTFSGRANRPEFWWFMLFVWLGTIAASIIDSAALGNYGLVSTIFGLGVLLPNIAVTVRRLHDTDRSGWWYFLFLIPLVGIIILIIWFCQRGTPGRNRFG